MISKDRISITGLIAGPTLFVIVLSVNVEGVTFESKIVLASAFWMATWWITEAIPIYATALLPLALFPIFNVTSLTQLASSYGDKVVFLLLGGFILAAAIEKSGLHERLALNMVRAFGTSPRNIIAGFMISTAMLSAWISNTATTLIMLPIAASIIAHVRNENERARFGTCLMLCVAYSASIGGVATLVGTPTNVVFASLSKSILNVDVSFAQWTVIGAPVSVIFLGVAWLYMVNLGARVGKEPIAEGKAMILERLRQLGTLTRQEKIVVVVFATTAALWITRGLVWGNFVPMVDDTTIAIICALALFVIPYARGKRVMDWASMAKVPWGVLILIGGGLALAAGFTQTGLDKWVAERIMIVDTTNTILIVAMIVGFTIFFGEIISNTAGVALIIPIGAGIAISLGMNPITVMLPIAIASSYSFMLPAGTAPNAIVFGSGYVTARQMFRAGVLLDLLAIGIVTLLTVLLVPLVWH